MGDLCTDVDPALTEGLSGPDLWVLTLTYQSWHEAKSGQAAWDALDLIPTSYWNDYLLWVRQAVGIDVQNETALTAIRPDDGCLSAEVEAATGEISRLYARKIVLATGQDRTGPGDGGCRIISTRFACTSVRASGRRYRFHCAPGKYGWRSRRGCVDLR